MILLRKSRSFINVDSENPVALQAVKNRIHTVTRNTPRRLKCVKSCFGSHWLLIAAAYQKKQD